MVEHPLWKEYFSRLRPSNKLPTREAVSTSYLDKEYNRVQANTSVIIADSRNLALQCDGWSNLRNEGILNFVVNTPKPIFVDFVNTKDNRHTSEYLCQEMKKILEKFGPNKFLVVIGDNAANMKKACKLLQSEYPHIVPLGCIAHTMHLLVNDILSTKSANVFIQRVVSIVKTIRQSQILSALLTEINTAKKLNSTLHLPVKTRWGSYLNCLDSMMKCKVSLQTFAVNEAASSLPRDMKNSLLDDDVFWTRVTSLADVLRPIVSWITKLEGDEPLTHKALYAFEDIDSSLSKTLPASLLSNAEEKQILEKATQRKEFAIAPIHLAAALLDPGSQGHLLSHAQQLEALEFIDQVASHMETVDSANVLVDLANYRAKEESWSKAFLWKCVDKITPVTWWKGMCGCSDLSQVAIRILTAPITSAATERSFSTFSRIHTKRRNRLTTQRAGKITFVAHNWKLLSSESGSQAASKKTLSSTDEQIASASHHNVSNLSGTRKRKHPIDCAEEEENVDNPESATTSSGSDEEEEEYEDESGSEVDSVQSVSSDEQ